MSKAEAGPSAEKDLLRRLLLAAQAGQEGPYRRVLHWAAMRARAAPQPRGDAEARVQATLRLLHALRHTYDPDRCPVEWIDSLIVGASRPKPAASGAAGRWNPFRPRGAG